MNDIPNLKIPTLSIARSNQRFPVRRIFCVGQNYADHAREMGSDPQRQLPFFFTKPADAVVDSGLRLPFPTMTHDLHHEVELVVALGQGGVDVKPADAPSMIFGHAVGIDLTRRDLQAEAKKTGRPWDMAKGFDHSAPIGPVTRGVPPREGAITLSIDGQVRQSGDLGRHDLERRGHHRVSLYLCRRRRGRSDIHGNSRRRGSDSARRACAWRHRGHRPGGSDVREVREVRGVTRRMDSAKAAANGYHRSHLHLVAWKK